MISQELSTLEARAEEERIPKHILLGIDFGLLIPGWNLKDYIEYAATHKDGYELVVVDGVQRSGKSNMSLQIISWAKKASMKISLGRDPTEKELWEAVLKNIVFTPADFVEALDKVPNDSPLDSILWDDLNAAYTNSTFKTDIELYSDIDSTFTVVGTKCRVIVVNIPVINRLARNVKDNATFEIFIGRNKKRKMMRIFRLPGTRDIDMNLFKPDVEPWSTFDIYKIPDWAWQRYETQRFELAAKVLQRLKANANLDTLEGYTPIPDAVKICRDAGLNWGISTLQSFYSRRIVKGQKVAGTLCVNMDSLNSLINAEKMAKKK